MECAEPILQSGNRVGCLCIHGFTDTPDQMRWMAEYLHQNGGYTVHAPRLSGHGTDPTDLSRYQWQDWLASALDGYSILRQNCDQVFVLGLSMGAVLSALVSIQEPVDGLVMMAAHIRLGGFGFRNTGWLKYFLRYSQHLADPRLVDVIKDEQIKRGDPVVGRVHYSRWSTHAVHELRKVMQVGDERLPQVTAPLLLIYSKADETVPVRNAQLLAERVQSETVEKVILEQSSHILTQDIERHTVFERVFGFIQKHVR